MVAIQIESRMKTSVVYEGDLRQWQDEVSFLLFFRWFFWKPHWVFANVENGFARMLNHRDGI